jgi:hypothetical protein
MKKVKTMIMVFSVTLWGQTICCTAAGVAGGGGVSGGSGSTAQGSSSSETANQGGVLSRPGPGTRGSGYIIVAPSSPPYPMSPESTESPAPSSGLPKLQPGEQGSGYYCQNPAGYYPSVQQCPSGWVKVAPSPQPPKQLYEGYSNDPKAKPPYMDD